MLVGFNINCAFCCFVLSTHNKSGLCHMGILKNLTFLITWLELEIRIHSTNIQRSSKLTSMLTIRKVDDDLTYWLKKYSTEFAIASVPIQQRFPESEKCRTMKNCIFKISIFRITWLGRELERQQIIIHQRLYGISQLTFILSLK